jgi:hypothetical protein
MERDYKVTIDMPKYIRDYYKSKHEELKKIGSNISWSKYISERVNTMLKEVIENRG